MTIPAALAASMTSWSRTEPPGWTTAVTPALVSDSRPSAKGKKASDAAAAPWENSPALVVAMPAATTLD